MRKLDRRRVHPRAFGWVQVHTSDLRMTLNITLVAISLVRSSTPRPVFGMGNSVIDGLIHKGGR